MLCENCKYRPYCEFPPYGTECDTHYTEKKIEWKYIKTDGAYGTSYEEYESTDGKYCKHIWSDGFEEVFEIAYSS